ncbi:hypothetical protein VNO78_18620 [Psophocarpus tetragonolobus]|uniref:Uncharacterized protein n=1 Tax=Psophocarpus tetragonolobus TaxID=3891 RepID=A0AAN9SPX4_PSOTE
MRVLANKIPEIVPMNQCEGLLDTYSHEYCLASTRRLSHAKQKARELHSPAKWSPFAVVPVPSDSPEPPEAIVDLRGSL